MLHHVHYHRHVPLTWRTSFAFALHVLCMVVHGGVLSIYYFRNCGCGCKQLCVGCATLSKVVKELEFRPGFRPFPMVYNLPRKPVSFFNKTHDLSFPFWPCGNLRMLSADHEVIVVSSNPNLSSSQTFFSLFWWYKTKKMAAPNDLLLELALPAELTDT